ncbi:AMP-binding protein [bacterium]|nr:AMP-binding protein [bacterium]
MLEIFTTTKFDDEIALIDDNRTYTFSNIKKQIAYQTEKLKDKNKNVVILGEDNYSFIIHFFASVFSGKNIYLITDRARLNDIDADFEVLDKTTFGSIENYDFPNIDVNNIFINFFTSGSTSKPKIITHSLYNIIFEGKDLGDEFDLDDENMTVMSTTTLCHRYGLVTHLMFPITHKLKIYIKSIAYPDNVDIENSVLVTTPSFLSSVFKYNIPFKVPPKYIFSAGSKLDGTIFEKLEKNSKVIEIYGSSETGDIAHKTHYSDNFRLFNCVDIKVNEDNIEVISDYIYNKSAIVNDKIEINNNQIIIKKRTDRMFKICEKRISADELEEKLKQHEFAEDCYITKYEDKLVCLCALSKTGQDYLLDNNVASLTKNLKQHLLKYSEIIPQKWKFIDEIPKTDMGKINKNFIMHLFNINLSLPVILSRTVEENIIIYKILFYKNCNFFKGHFPEFEIVPGVAQIYLAKEFANAHFQLNLGQGQWKRIKFSNIIEPDSIVYLKLEKTEKHVSYEYYSDTKKYASGVFLCENIFEEILK